MGELEQKRSPKILDFTIDAEHIFDFNTEHETGLYWGNSLDYTLNRPSVLPQSGDTSFVLFWSLGPKLLILTDGKGSYGNFGTRDWQQHY